ncbi:MAG TPA: hypothetical protein VFT90_13830, partial [Chryseosolibacter sp.]|nr:hypothetical protein [Chryseosolibacter sp.]
HLQVEDLMIRFSTPDLIRMASLLTGLGPERNKTDTGKIRERDLPFTVDGPLVDGPPSTALGCKPEIRTTENENVSREACGTHD